MGALFFFLGILGILINTFYVVVYGSFLAVCLWVCKQLWKDLMQ